MAIVKEKIVNPDEDVGQRNPQILMVQVKISSSSMEISMAFSLKKVVLLYHSWACTQGSQS
jgi:hypothetical protein